ncbi:1057_t:CDS:1, partial [Gigaspora margarita]
MNVVTICYYVIILGIHYKIHMIHVIGVITVKDEEVLNYSNADIGSDDIVDIFLHANNARTRARGYDQLWRPKALKTKELAKHALQEMVILGLVRQVILLQRHSPTSTSISQ